jgi:pSer/pThr/pTyr-binding forkhead associated (FHA) protein
MNPQTAPKLRVSVATQRGDCQSYVLAWPFRIGRVRECEVFVDEEHVSRNHAQVSFENGQWVVKDLKSANGLYIGDERLERITVGSGTTFRLGIQGPFVTIELEAPFILPPIEARVEKYFKETPGETVGDHTIMVRRAIQQVQKKQRSKWLAVVAVLAVAAIGTGAYAIYVSREAKKQRALAEDIFYAMKSLDMQLAANPAPAYREQRRELEKSYDRYLDSLHVYDPKMTEPDRLVLRVARIFGECELAMPPGFAAEVKEYIRKWQGSPRMGKDLQLAREKGYIKTITDEMVAAGLPPQFLYMAMQESDFDAFARGPMTRKGFAKGMWQFIPETASKYGLKIGPLADLARVDVGDERHDYLKETRAATRYLKDLYTTDAQASGLLVMACYNWGEDYVLPLVRQMPLNPRERNFWKLLDKDRDRIPTQTYDYVFYIFSAAVIGENPKLFGFDFENPLL